MLKGGIRFLPSLGVLPDRVGRRLVSLVGAVASRGTAHPLRGEGCPLATDSGGKFY